MSIINFMVYCNGRMFFLKSVNATGLTRMQITFTQSLERWFMMMLGKNVLFRLSQTMVLTIRNHVG